MANEIENTNESEKRMSCPRCKSQNIQLQDGVYRCLDCGSEWNMANTEQPTERSVVIRNSTMEFLIFQAQTGADGIEVMYANESIWCTQDAIAALFDKGRSTITEHLQNIFSDGELKKDSVCRKCRRTAADGKNYSTQYYNLGKLPFDD